MTLLTQTGDHCSCGVVGIDDEVERCPDIGNAQQGEHLVEQRFLVAIRPDDALSTLCSAC